MRVVNVEDHTVNCPDVTDDGDLEEGVEDMGFDLNDYEGTEELSSLPSTTASLLPPMLKQPGLHTIMNSRSSDVTPVMRLSTSVTNALSTYRL